MKVSQHQKISVLIPDGESHLAIQVVNCFSMVKHVDVFFVSSKKINHMKYSRYLKKYFYFPKTTSEKWMENVDLLVEKYNIDVIMPVFEFGFKDIITSQKYLRNKSKLCPLPKLSDALKAQNKELLYQHLKANDIPCPDSYIVDSGGELPNFRKDNFPVVIKPVIGYGGGQGVKIANSYNEVVEYYNKEVFNCNTIIQEYVFGYDVTSNVLCKNGEILAFSVQEGNLYMREDKVSPQIGFRFVDEKNLLPTASRLMKSLNWSGIANIDWRFDKKEKVFKVIEINTRYWQNTDASALAGVNFPHLYCLSALNYKFDELQQAEHISYLNLKGLVKTIKNKPMSLFRINYLFNNTPILFALKDPIPMIYKFIWRTKNIILSNLKKERVN